MNLSFTAAGDLAAAGAFDQFEVYINRFTGIFRFDFGLLGNTGSRATDMEGSEGQLCARFTNGLSGNNTNRFADIDRIHDREITAITIGTHAALGFAGQYRTNSDHFDSGFFDSIGMVLVDFLSGLDDNFVGDRVIYIIKGHTTENTIGERLDYFFTLFQGGNVDPENGIAIGLGDDYILSHVDQSPCQIPGISRLQGRIGQTFTSTVRGNEIFRNRQTLTEV